MKKESCFLKISVVVLAVVGIYFFMSDNSGESVCFEDKCVDVEIAKSLSERQEGLMFVSELDEDLGMLFIFQDSARHGFWMKNTLIPLDIIWISESLEIVDIQTATPCEEDPCPIYTPEAEARYVLEVNAGWAERNEVMLGDLARE